MAKKDSAKGLGVNPADSLNYGWEGRDNFLERSDKFHSVNPGSSFNSPVDWAINGLRYLFGIQREDFSTKHEEALWFRYLGGRRDKSQLPDTKVRFSRDFDENNQLNKTKEYVGLPREQKDAIRDKVISNMKEDLTPGKWVPVKDNINRSTDQRGVGNVLSGLGKFGLRNNNGSGIYDIVDTYDFPGYIPVPDRNKGYELEIRDTVWTKDAKPELYRKENGYHPYTHNPNGEKLCHKMDTGEGVSKDKSNTYKLKF